MQRRRLISISHLCKSRAAVVMDERGQALAVVTAFLAALFLVPIFVTAIAVNQTVLARHSVGSESVFAAAQAGLTDYVNSLNANPLFPAENASNSPYAAFGSDTGTATWEPVPGSVVECFSYKTDSVSGSSVTVTVTGRIGSPSFNCVRSAGGQYQYKTIGVNISTSPGVPATLLDFDGDDPDDDGPPPAPPTVSTEMWTENNSCPTGTVGSDGQEVISASACS